MFCDFPHSKPFLLRLRDSSFAIFSPEIMQAVTSSVFPLILTLAFTAAIGVVDVYLAGLVSENAQAGVGIADQVLFMAILLATGLTTGVAACVSRAKGAGEPGQAALYARDGLLVSAWLGAIAATVALLSADLIMPLFAANKEACASGSIYLKWCSIGNLPYCLAISQTAILRASGRTRLCVAVWGLIATVSIGLAMALILFVPAVKDHLLVTVAFTWDLGAFAGCILGFYCLRKFDLIDCKGAASAASSQSTSGRRILQFFQIGLPVAATEACWIASNFVMYALFSHMQCGADAQAAWTIRMKVDEIAALTPLLAFSLTAQTIAGNKLGAGDVAGARRTIVSLTAVATVIMVLLGAGIAMFSHSLAVIFTPSPSTQRATELLLLASPVLLPVMAVYLVIFGALEGAGYTRPPMLAIVGGLFLIRFPAAFWLGICLHHELNGVLIAVCLSHAAAALSALFLFKSRRWERIGLNPDE